MLKTSIKNFLRQSSETQADVPEAIVILSI